MPVVLLPRSLIALFPGAERRYELDGATVDELLGALDGRVAGMRERLVDAGPRLRPHINVYVDGERARLDTAVAAAATVHIIPAVSGGSTGPVSKRPASRPRRASPFPRPISLIALDPGYDRPYALHLPPSTRGPVTQRACDRRAVRLARSLLDPSSRAYPASDRYERYRRGLRAPLEPDARLSDLGRWTSRSSDCRAGVIAFRNVRDTGPGCVTG